MYPNNAISRLYHHLHNEYKRLVEVQDEMEKFAPGYFRYLELLRDQEHRRERALKLFGVLGVYAPPCPKKAFAVLCPGGRDMSSLEVRETLLSDRGNELKLWEILELYLTCVGEARTGDFKRFLMYVDWSDVSLQAIDSAIKTHPSLFEERHENRDKFVSLRTAGNEC